jgi:hypothetical protein
MLVEVVVDSLLHLIRQHLEVVVVLVVEQNSQEFQQQQQ